MSKFLREGKEGARNEKGNGFKQLVSLNVKTQMCKTGAVITDKKKKGQSITITFKKLKLCKYFVS
jgi:hypothetical protein